MDIPWNKLGELEKDTVTRRIELIKAEDSRDYTVEVVGVQKQNAEQVRRVMRECDKRRRALSRAASELLEKEAGRGQGGDQQALQWARNFKQHAVESLVYALIRMQVTIRRAQELNRVRRVFRELRLLYIDGKVRHMYNYFRMRRYLQICARYRAVYRAMPRYHLLRTKYVAFNRWLSFLETLYALRTRDLSRQYKRRRALASGLDALLREQRLVATHYDPDFLNALTGTRRALFLRWALYTQRQVAFRDLTQRLRGLHRLRFLRRVLWAWRHGAAPRFSYPFRSSEPPRGKALRLMADVGVVRGWFVATERLSLARRITIRNRKWARSLRDSVTSGQSFKKGMSDYQREVRPCLCYILVSWPTIQTLAQ